MDRAIFVLMNGIQQRHHALRSSTNNLANVNTIGYKSEEHSLKHRATGSSNFETRHHSYGGGKYSNFMQGPLILTDRDLDIALTEPASKKVGMIAVQSGSGQEGYTRNGSLNINKDGILVTSKGEMVLAAEGGVLSVADASKISIGSDGTVKGQRSGEGTPTSITFGKIKLVEADAKDYEKGEDALYHVKEGATATPAENVKLVVGSIEGSNVNAMHELTKLIDISRNYEMQMKLMKTIEDYDSNANRLLDGTK